MPEITDDADLMEDDSDDDLSSLDEDEAAAAAEFEDMSDMESVDTENEELVGAQDDGDGSLSEGGSDGVMNDAGVCCSSVAAFFARADQNLGNLLCNPEFDSEDDEAFELDEDEDDLLDEDEMPDIELPGMVDGEETSGKRKRAGEDDKKEKRKKKAKLVRLPDFASCPFDMLITPGLSIPSPSHSRFGVRTRTTRNSSTTAVPRTTSECDSDVWSTAPRCAHQQGDERCRRGWRQLVKGTGPLSEHARECGGLSE